MTCTPVRKLVTPNSRDWEENNGLYFIENMERETGLEPAASNLGIWHSFEYREHLRPLRCILTICNHRDSTTCPKTPLNGVNGVTKSFVNSPSFFSFLSP